MVQWLHPKTNPGHQEVCSGVFFAPLFLKAPDWSQPRCPTTAEEE